MTSKIQLGLFSLQWQLFPGWCAAWTALFKNMSVRVCTKSIKLKIVDTEEKINNFDLEIM